MYESVVAAEEIFDQRAFARAQAPRTGRTLRPHRARFVSNRVDCLAVLLRPLRSPALSDVSLECPGTTNAL